MSQHQLCVAFREIATFSHVKTLQVQEAAQVAALLSPEMTVNFVAEEMYRVQLGYM